MLSDTSAYFLLYQGNSTYWFFMFYSSSLAKMLLWNWFLLVGCREGRALKAGWLSVWLSKYQEGTVELWAFTLGKEKILGNAYKISQLTHASELRQEMKAHFCYTYHQTVKLEALGSSGELLKWPNWRQLISFWSAAWRRLCVQLSGVLFLSFVVLFLPA